MAVLHDYRAQVIWTGNRGQGTKTYGGYARSWDLCSPGKPVISCSNDPILGGNPALYNPEDLLISALSACHMLWYLHLASEAGYVFKPIKITLLHRAKRLQMAPVGL